MNPEIKVFGQIGDPEDGITAKQFDEALHSHAGAGEVDVLINSNGGSVIEGVAIAEAIRTFEGKVNTIIVGGAYSIAGFIACSGTGRRVIRRKGMLHIHGPRVSTTDGSLQAHEDSVEELRVATKSMGNHYAEITGRPYDEIVSQFNRDRFYDADEAVELGFMTEVDGGDSPVVPMQGFKDINGLPRKFAAALLQAEPDHSPESETMASATIKEMKFAFKGASAEFLVEQVEAEADMATATANYIRQMESDIKAAKAESTQLKKQLEAMDEDDMEAVEEDEPTAEDAKDKEIAALKAKLKAMETEAMEDDDTELEAEEDDAEATDDEDDELAALRAQVEAFEKKRATALRKTKPGKRRGARAVRTATRARGPSRKSAAAEVDARVKAKLAENDGMSKRDAAQAVYKEDPKLRERYVEEANDE